MDGHEPRSVDQVARDQAQAALSAIGSHERLCEERLSRILDGQERIRQSIALLHGRWWAVLCSVVGSLVLMVVGLIAWIASAGLLRLP